MTDDSALLRRYAEDGAEEAFTELVHRHINLVYSVALRRLEGDAHLAQDVTQRVFIDLARKAATVARHPSLSGWLHTSAQFSARDAVRTERRRRDREQKAYAMQAIMAEADEEPRWETIRPVLDEALCGLSEKDRDAIALRFFEGRAFAEIGARLQMKEDAARMRVDRALEKLHRLLARRGIRTTAAALTLGLAQHATFAAPAGLAAAVSQAAVSAAAASAAGALPLLALVKAKLAGVGSTVAAVAAATTSVSLVTVVWHQGQELAQVSQAAEQSAASLRELDRTIAERDAALARRDELRRRLAAAQAQLAARVVAAAPGRSNEDRSEAIARALREAPEYARFEQQRRRLEMMKKYGPLFAELVLAPDELAALKDLLVAQIAAAETARQLAREAGLDLTEPAATEAIAQAAASRISELRALLGPERFRMYQDFESMVAAHSETVANFAADLADAGWPISAAEQHALLRAFYDELGAEQSPAAVSRTTLTPQEERLVQRAATLLPSGRAERLRDFLVYERRRLELRRALLAAHQNSEP